MQNTVHKQALDAYVDMLPISILQAHTDIIHARKKYKEHKRICTHNRDIVYTHSTETLRTLAHTHDTETLHTCTHNTETFHIHTIQKHFTYTHNTETLHTSTHAHTHTLKQYETLHAYTHTHTIQRCYTNIPTQHSQYRCYTHAHNTHSHTQFTHDTTQTHLSTTSIVDRITIRCVIFITIIDWNCEMLQQ